MIFQVAECGRITEPAGKEVLVKAQDLRAGAAGPLRQQTHQKVLKVAFHGGSGNGLALPHAAAADAIPMILEHFATKRLGGVLSRQQPGEPFPKAAAAIPAPPQPAGQP